MHDGMIDISKYQDIEENNDFKGKREAQNSSQFIRGESQLKKLFK